jgi:hypothetical protein
VGVLIYPTLSERDNNVDEVPTILKRLGSEDFHIVGK